MRPPKFLIPLVAVAAIGCRATLFNLPAPPPDDERRSVSLVPGEEERKAEQGYLEARARVIELVNLLATRRFEEAVPLLSLETQDWLRSMGGGAELAEILAAGKLQLPDGQVVDFDPVSTLVAEDVSKLSDSVDGVEEQETDGRREIFATLPSGKIQKVVLIAEGGQWVLHRTRFSPPIDPPDATR